MRASSTWFLSASSGRQYHQRQRPRTACIRTTGSGSARHVEQGVGKRGFLGDVAEVGREDPGGAAPDAVVARGQRPRDLGLESLGERPAGLHAGELAAADRADRLGGRALHDLALVAQPGRHGGERPGAAGTRQGPAGGVAHERVRVVEPSVPGRPAWRRRAGPRRGRSRRSTARRPGHRPAPRARGRAARPSLSYRGRGRAWTARSAPTGSRGTASGIARRGPGRASRRTVSVPRGVRGPLS